MSQPAKALTDLLVRDNDAKKGELWSNTAKGRFIKQHGSVDEIPEGDAHAVPVYNDPLQLPSASPEEKKAAEEKLEEQIKSLKAQIGSPVPPQQKGNNFYDEWID